MSISFTSQMVRALGPSPSEEISLLKHIELCGRVAYKSEDRITTDSAQKFVTHLRDKEHLSVLEHGNIVIHVTQEHTTQLRGVIRDLFDTRTAYHQIYGHTFVGGNIRAWMETLDFLKETNSLSYVCFRQFFVENYPTFFSYLVDERMIKSNVFNIQAVRTNEQCKLLRHHHYDLPLFTFHITCDRGITHELVRHRTMSFTQESTRYVNYGNRGVTFIRPPCGDYSYLIDDHLDQVAELYTRLVQEGGVSPQYARDVLPNLLKGEIYMTGTCGAWEHFTNLRGARDAHPRIQVIARDIDGYFNKFFRQEERDEV